MNISEKQIQKLKSFFKNIKISEDPKALKKYAEEDRQFHHFLMEIGGNDLLSSILSTYSIIILSYLGGHQEGLVRSPKETINEHLALIDAISIKDPVKAEELARLHLKRSRERLIREITEDEQGGSKNNSERGEESGN